MTVKHSPGFHLIAASVSALLVWTTVVAQDAVRKSNKPVIRQESIGSMGCAPCAILNMAANGTDEMQKCTASLPGKTPEDQVRSLIEKYGSTPSTVYVDKRARFTQQNGVTLQELPDFVNDFLRSKSSIQVTGAFLDRTTKEPPDKHTARVWSTLRKSLDAGIPPIIEMRSYAARPAGSEFKWEGLLGHFVVVVELDPIGEGEKGFRFRFSDSNTGNIETGYAYAEEARNFSATKRFSVTADGTEKYEWITDYPYLLVSAPALRMLTQKEPWQTRTTIALRYAVTSKPSAGSKR